MVDTHAGRIRGAALALAAGGLVSVVGLALRGPNVPANTDPQGFAEAAAESSHQLAWLILLPGPMLLMFGFLGIAWFARGTAHERLAFRGAMLSILGNALYLPFLGISAFVDTPAAELYLAGEQAAVTVVERAMFGGAGLQVLLLSVVVLVVGTVMQAMVIWRHDGLPRWAAIPYVLQVIGLTIAAQSSYVVEFSGGVLLLVSSLAIAAAMWRRASEPAGVPAAAGVATA